MTCRMLRLKSRISRAALDSIVWRSTSRGTYRTVRPPALTASRIRRVFSDDPDLDDLIGEKIPEEPGDYLSQQGGLGSGRVVFRQLGDALEEDGPRPVIKVLRRQGLLPGRQPLAHVLLEPLLLGSLVRVHFHQVAHGVVLRQATCTLCHVQAEEETTGAEGITWLR